MRYSLLAGGKRDPAGARARHRPRDRPRAARASCRSPPRSSSSTPTRSSTTTSRRWTTTTCAAAARRTTRRSARTSRSWPATGSTPRRSGHVLTRQAGEPGAASWPPSPSWPTATGVDGMVGGQYIDVAGRGGAGPEGLRRLHELKTGRLIGASVECVLLLAGASARPLQSPTALRRRARSALPDRGRHPRRDRDGRRARQAPGQRRASRQADVRDSSTGSTARANWPPRRTRRRAQRSTQAAPAAPRRSSSRSPTSSSPAPHDPRLLDRIDRPQDLHALSEESSPRSRRRSASHIIDTVGEIGGHFGANLGTCELAVALHSLLDSPRDKILWDVGHQAYPHKVLTGRRDQLATIRQYEGLAPFCSIAESEHDIMGAGHASTSIGYAVGLKEAMRLRGETDARQGRRRHRRRRDDRRRRVRGDPPGRRPRHADRRRAQRQRHVDRAERRRAVALLQPRPAEPEALARARGRRGAASPTCPAASAPAFERLGPQLKESIKAFWAPGLFWEELDWAYIGVIDGHDVRALRGALRKALDGRPPGRRPHRDGQGQGLRARRGRRPGGHGEVACRQAEVDRRPRAGPEAAAGKTRNARAPPQYTQVFGEALVARGARATARVVGITAAMNSGTGLEHPAEGDARALLRRRHRRAAGACCSPPAWRSRASSRSRRSTRPSCSARSTRSSTTSACRTSTSSSRWTAPASSATTARRTTARSTSPTCARCRTSSLMAPRDEAMLVHMLRTALPTTTARSRLRYPRGEARRRRRCPTSRRADRDRARARSCARAPARRDRRLRQRRREGPGGGRPAGRRAASR